MYRFSSCIEDDRLRGHVTVDDREAVRFWGPGNIVDRSIFIEVNSGVESTVRAQQIHCCLSIITFAGLVDLCLCQDDQGGACIIPLKLNLVALEEVLLRDWGGEVRNVVYSNCSWLALLLSASNLDREFHLLTFLSGTNTAMLWFSPGETARSVTPSTRNLFQTLVRS